MTIFQLGQPSVVIDQVRTGFGLTAQSSRNKGVRGQAALKMLTSTTWRRVCMAMIGDSQQMYNGNGYDDGWAKALAAFAGLFASPIYIQEIGGTAQSNQGFATSAVSGAANSAATGAPSELAAFALPSGGFVPGGAAYCYQATGDIGNSNGVAWAPATGVDVNANLRAHFCYGTFPGGGGSFTPAWRREDTQFSPSYEGTTVSTDGAYSKQIATYDLPAATRNYTVAAKWKKPSGTASVGPNIQYWLGIENLDLDHGIQVSTFYGIGGKSLYDMATFFTSASDASLVNYFEGLRHFQEVSGLDPQIVVYICSGHNDRNETRSPSLGPNPSNSPKSAAAYIDNLNAIVNRLRGIWDGQGWTSKNLTFLALASHPDSNDTQVALYRAALKDWVKTRTDASTFDLTTVISWAQIQANGWVSAEPHLTQAGYEGIAQLAVNAIVA